MINMKPADLVFIRGTGGISKLIEDISHSKYSHVAGLVKAGDLFEAQAFRKTGDEPVPAYTGVADVYTCEGATDEQRQKIVQYVLSMRGTNYDYLVLPWEAAHFMFHVNLPYKETDEHDCSTLWQQAYLQGGIDLCPGLKFAAPGDISGSKLLRYVGSY